MQAVARIELGIQLRMVRRVLHDARKIKRIVELTTVQDPVVDAEPRPLPLWIAIWLQRRVRAAERRDGGAEHGNPGGMYARDDLLESLDQAVADDLLGLRVRRLVADIVDAFEDHGVLDARLGEDVAVDATHRVRPEAVCEDAVAAGGLVEDADVGGGGVRLHLGQDEVGPAGVG